MACVLLHARALTSGGIREPIMLPRLLGIAQRSCDGTSPLQFDPDDLMIADEMQYELIILRAPTCSLPSIAEYGWSACRGAQSSFTVTHHSLSSDLSLMRRSLTDLLDMRQAGAKERVTQVMALPE
ncbi:unnamed protein product [Cercospora beticola]|nr:unnamed protein product [Cercospora beticola]